VFYRSLLPYLRGYHTEVGKPVSSSTLQNRNCGRGFNSDQAGQEPVTTFIGMSPSACDICSAQPWQNGIIKHIPLTMTGHNTNVVRHVSRDALLQSLRLTTGLKSLRLTTG
jgi:hypothetical protein